MEYNSDYQGFKSSLSQIVAVLIRNTFVIGYGVALAYPTILIPGLSDQDSKSLFAISNDEISWIGSINMICVPIGCLFSGILADGVGRKTAMLLTNVPLFIAWLIFQFSTKIWHIYCALCLTGLSGGLFEVAVITYVSEICEPHLRGALLATNGFSYTIGALIQFTLGSVTTWRSVARVCCAISVISMSLLLLIPESPYWLVINNNFEKARKSLAWLRGWTKAACIENEFRRITAECGKHDVDFSSQKTLAQNHVNRENYFQNLILRNKKYLKRPFLWPLFIVTFTFFLSTFTGSCTLMPYAIQIFNSFHVPINTYYTTIILGVMQIIGISINVIIVKFLGKRITAFVSLTGIGLCSLVVAIFAFLKDIEFTRLDEQEGTFNITAGDYSNIYKWIPCIFVILLDFCSNCGLNALPWILLAELFSNDCRATGCCISAIIGCLFGFASRKSFIQLVYFIKLSGTYTLYSVISFSGLVVLYFILPETEGKTLDSIQVTFLKNEKKCNALVI